MRGTGIVGAAPSVSTTRAGAVETSGQGSQLVAMNYAAGTITKGPRAQADIHVHFFIASISPRVFVNERKKKVVVDETARGARARSAPERNSDKRLGSRSCRQQISAAGHARTRSLGCRRDITTVTAMRGTVAASAAPSACRRAIHAECEHIAAVPRSGVVHIVAARTESSPMVFRGPE